jgi:hypothetical protein
VSREKGILLCIVKVRVGDITVDCKVERRERSCGLLSLEKGTFVWMAEIIVKERFYSGYRQSEGEIAADY